MKILILSFYYPPDLCAGSFRTASIVEALRKKDSSIKIDLVTTIPNRYHTYSKSSRSFECKDGISIKRIKLPSHKSGMIDQAKAFLTYFIYTLKLVKNNNYDLVFATSSRLMTAFLGSCIAKKTNTPLYLDIRDIFTETLNQILPYKISVFITPLLNLIENRTFMRSKHINLVSEGFTEYFKKRYPSVDYTFFTNGIDDIFLNSVDTKQNRKNSKYTILYAGNIGQGQGLHDFLPSFALKTQDKYKFRIIGDGGMMKPLKDNLISSRVKNVELIDPVERSQLLKEYGNADVLFLHLNDYNAFKKVLPSKIFEYAAMGKPILAGVTGYPAEFLTKNVSNSVVFHPCDVYQANKSLRSLDLRYTVRNSFIMKFSRTRIMNEMAKSIISVTLKHSES